MANEAPKPKPGQTKETGPGQPWSDLETHNLIECYEEKWYSLKRGPLKAQQWEDVAACLAARCGFTDPSKTGTQCRHKMEKLRKRYRAEKQRPFLSRWLHFDRMDQMERGPVTISARPPPLPDQRPKTFGAGAAEGDSEDGDDDGDNDGSQGEEEIKNNSRNINRILREESWVFPKVSRNHKSRGEEREGGGAIRELASVVMKFGEGFVRMEKRRLEVMREMERDRLEMVAKTAEMVMESERCLMDTIMRQSYYAKRSKNSD